MAPSGLPIGIDSPEEEVAHNIKVGKIPVEYVPPDIGKIV